MGNTTLGVITLHDGATAVMNDNNTKKSAELIAQPLYTQDSDETEVMDYGGTIKKITLSGTKIADNIAALKVWIDALEGLINGQQDHGNSYPITLADDLRGTILVKVEEVDTSMKEGEVVNATWTVKLIQAASTV